MPRQAKPADLDLHGVDGRSAGASQGSSPINVDISTFGGDFGGSAQNETSSPKSVAKSPPTSPRLGRDSARTFFGGTRNKSTKEEPKSNAPYVGDEDENIRPGTSNISKIYHLKKNPGSTPELNLVGSGDSTSRLADEQGHRAGPPSQGPESPPPAIDPVATLKKRDRTFRNPLVRTKSRSDSKSKSDEPRPTFSQAPKTAPLAMDWPGSDMRMLQAQQGREKRGKSAERAIASESDDNGSEGRSWTKDSHKEKGGFMSGGRHVVSKAKTGGGNFLTRLGKMARSSSTHERDIPDSEYVLRVINKPLVEQVRITRISKNLNNCRDKTEYWMPSLPWRCIDYLNLNCETEGLYRVPGSGPQVKMWQRRFDTELDVDLLDEKELYDPNNISSMLKSWLRELPSEIMPNNIQSALAAELEKENPDYQKIGQPAPQRLRDALSELPPFNYYLLFAITCHLSLLLSHKDKNKMDLNNLSICIGPCLKMDRWLFNYLVGDWRHCWQGCHTEKEYLEIEKAHEMGIEYLPLAIHPTNGSMQNLTLNDRGLGSRGSGRPSEEVQSQRTVYQYQHPGSGDAESMSRTRIPDQNGGRHELHIAVTQGNGATEQSRNPNGRSWLDG